MIDLHVHSNFSDGDNSPEEIVNEGILLGYKVIGLCEHVRKETDWFDDYLAEIRRLKQKYAAQIRILTAIEAKVLDFEGNIDARPEFFQADLVYAAVHRVPCGEGKFHSSFEKAGQLKRDWIRVFEAVTLRNKNAHALAHPVFPAVNFGFDIEDKEIEQLATILIGSGKALEINIKYKHPACEQLLFRLAGKVPFTLGTDSHSITEMRTRRKALMEAFHKWGNYLLLPPV
ncbi:MAG: PHP domain-containing protein [Bacillota bacterium]